MSDCKVGGCYRYHLKDSKYCKQHHEEMMAKWDFEKSAKEAHDEYYGLEKEPKFKVGDVVEVVGDFGSGHCFEEGEVVTVTRLTDYGYDCQGFDGVTWAVGDREVKPAGVTKVDNVNHPSHYGQGKIEAIEYISDFLTPEEYQGYLRGNIAKYLHRWPYKNKVEDLKKAAWYLDRLIKEVGE